MSKSLVGTYDDATDKLVWWHDGVKHAEELSLRRYLHDAIVEVELLTMVVEDLNRLGAGVYDAGLEAALRIAEKMLRECKGSFSIPDAIRAEIKGPTDDEGMGYT